MLKVALTGGIATGKSYVLDRLRAAGVPVIDSDALVHSLFAAGTAVSDAVRARFGDAVMAPDGTVDRRALGRIVFADAAARAELERIVHPAVYKAILDWLADLEARGQPIGVADIPLLFETGKAGDFDRVIVTACAPATQVARVVRRDGISEAEARQRLAAQWPIEEKARRATHVIPTDGTFEQTNRQIDTVLDDLRRVAAG